jgi:drug/metabolite transporter (DMT)-like permease
MLKENLRAYTAILFSMAFFAFSYVWFKVANRAYPPVTIIILRLFISVVILSLFLALTGRFKKIKKGDARYFFLIAMCEPFLYFIFEGYGLTLVSSTVASVVVSTIPVFTAIGALIIFSERLTPLNYTGIVISFTGIMVFMLTGESNLVFNPLGIFLMFMAVICATGYSLLLRKLIDNYSAIYIVNTQNIIALLLFLPLFIFVDGRHITALEWNGEAITAIFRLAIFASSGAFILLAYSVKRIGITRANLFANLIPVMTALYAFYTIGESITIEKAGGIIIMITGLYLSQITHTGRSRIETPVIPQ